MQCLPDRSRVPPRLAGTRLGVAGAVAVFALLAGCNGRAGDGDVSAQPGAVSDAGQSGTAPDGQPGGEPGQAVNPQPAACLGLGEPVDDLHRQFFDLLNQYRIDHGLAPLEYSVLLEQAADQHAASMYRDDFFEHLDPITGTGPAERAVAAGFCHEYVGENIAWGQNTHTRPAEVIDGFSLRPLHNANMLNSDYRYVGLGIFHTENEEGDWYWWVQDFALDLGD
ncbi:MAG: CAP domain-containing protein [Planctomycetes bacterium]|nr:CAP domain-containing protein [Planctomycetota bacterium]